MSLKPGHGSARQGARERSVLVEPVAKPAPGGLFCHSEASLASISMFPASARAQNPTCIYRFQVANAESNARRVSGGGKGFVQELQELSYCYCTTTVTELLHPYCSGPNYCTTTVVACEGRNRFAAVRRAQWKTPLLGLNLDRHTANSR